MYFEGNIRPLCKINITDIQKSVKLIPEFAWEFDWRKKVNKNFYDSYTIWMRSLPYSADSIFHVFDTQHLCYNEDFKKDWKDFQSCMESMLDGIIVRSAIVRLLPGRTVKRHLDGKFPIFRFSRRLIVPIISGQKSFFNYDDVDHVLEEGMIYDSNPFVPHGTSNFEEYSRYQAVIDFFPKEIPESIISLQFHSWDRDLYFQLQEKVDQSNRDEYLPIWKEIYEEEKNFFYSAPYLEKFR